MLYLNTNAELVREHFRRDEENPTAEAAAAEAFWKLAGDQLRSVSIEYEENDSYSFWRGGIAPRCVQIDRWFAESASEYDGAIDATLAVICSLAESAGRAAYDRAVA